MIAETIQKLKSLGYTISVYGENIKLVLQKGKPRPIPETAVPLFRILQQYKPEVIQILQRKQRFRPKVDMDRCIICGRPSQRIAFGNDMLGRFSCYGWCLSCRPYGSNN
ncbi:MAG: hypothetical protein FJ264_17590 [Planctomycetes bacterium]|nr:hypothetical protein [Planctomycetota bacterium]